MTNQRCQPRFIEAWAYMSVPCSSVLERADNIWWQTFFSRSLSLPWGTDHCRADMGRVLVASLCSFSPTLLLSHYRWSASSLRFLPLPVPWHGPSHSSHTAQGHPGAQKRGRSWWSSSWWDKTMAQWKCPPCKWVSRGNTASWELRWTALPFSSSGKGYSAFRGAQKRVPVVLYFQVSACSVQL